MLFDPCPRARRLCQGLISSIYAACWRQRVHRFTRSCFTDLRLTKGLQCDGAAAKHGMMTSAVLLSCLSKTYAVLQSSRKQLAELAVTPRNPTSSRRAYCPVPEALSRPGLEAFLLSRIKARLVAAVYLYVTEFRSFYATCYGINVRYKTAVVSTGVAIVTKQFARCFRLCCSALLASTEQLVRSCLATCSVDTSQRLRLC